MYDNSSPATNEKSCGTRTVVAGIGNVLVTIPLLEVWMKCTIELEDNIYIHQEKAEQTSSVHFAMYTQFSLSMSICIPPPLDRILVTGVVFR